MILNLRTKQSPPSVVDHMGFLPGLVDSVKGIVGWNCTLIHTSQNWKVLVASNNGCLILPEYLEKSLCFYLSLITKHLICGISILFYTEKGISVHKGFCPSS